MRAGNYSQYTSQSEFKWLALFPITRQTIAFLTLLPAHLATEQVMTCGTAPSLHSPCSDVPRVTHYACKRTRLPRWSSHAKAQSTTVKFLNLHKTICVQVSEHTSALTAQKISTLFLTDGSSNGNKGEVKTVLGHLMRMLHTKRRAPEPRSTKACMKL